MKKIISLVVSALLLMTSLNIAVMAAPVVDADTGVITIDAVADRESTSTVTWYKSGASASENVLMFQHGNDNFAEYKVTVDEAGLYRFSAFASGQSSDTTWNFAYVKINGTEQIVQGANNIIQYPRSTASWFNIITGAGFDWYTPGFVNLSSGENTITVKIRTVNGQQVALGKIKLTPVDANTTEMIDENGKAIIPMNRLSNYSGVSTTSDPSDDYLSYRPKLNGGDVTFDVYTQKAGRYMLSGDIYFGEYGGNYVFYYENVTVNGTSVYTGTTANAIATETDPGVARVTKDACVVELLQGKNTITVKLMSDRKANWVRIYSYNLTQYIPSFSFDENDSVTVSTTKDNWLEGTAESSVGILYRGNKGYYAIYRVTNAKAADYTIKFNYRIAQNDAGYANIGGFIATCGESTADCSVRTTDDTNAVKSGFEVGTVRSDSAVITLSEGTNDIMIKVPVSFSKICQTLTSIELTKVTNFIDSFSLSATAFDADETVTATATIEDAAKAPTNKDVFIFIAKYDSLGELINVDFTKWNGTDDSITASITADSDTDEIKAFLWTDDLTPLKTIPAIKKKQQ